MNLVKLEGCKTKEEILEQLINEFENKIKSFCYSYIRDWSTAEDLTQEVFITCFKKLDNFRGESSYKTWLAKIAVNKCRDLLKKKSLRIGIPLDPFTEILKGQDVSIEDELIMKEKVNFLWEQVFSLPEKYREIIILYYYKEFKIWEIEKITGLNQDTIKSRLRRAKHQLRKNIGGVQI